MVAEVAGWLGVYGKWKMTGLIIVNNAADTIFVIPQSSKEGSIEDNSVYSPDFFPQTGC